MSDSEHVGRSDRKFAEKGVDRLVFFSDAVVAIAITLVVLPLVDSAREVSTESTAAFFEKNSYAFLAAAISFVVISRFWRQHHRLFNRAIGYNALLMRLNEVWLAGIAFLPLATVLEVNAHDDTLASTLYIGVIGVTMLAARLEAIVLQRYSLVEPAVAPSTRVAVLQWVPMGLLVAALVTSVLVPSAQLFSLLLLLLARPIDFVVLRAWRAGSAGSAE